MRYRRLGNTGFIVSEVGFGTIPVLKGSVPVLPGYYNLEEEEAVAVMEYAHRLGCNLYDTAVVPEYGDAEIKLGKFAQKIGRDRIVISDKARFFDGSGMYRAVEESCENLGTYPDLYFVHQADAEHGEEIFRKYGALDALSELKARGMIRFVGVASHYYDILLRAAVDKRVDVLQMSGNIFERGMLERVKGEPRFLGKGILVNKVYAAGLLPAFFPAKELVDGVLSYPVSCALIGIGTRGEADAAMGNGQKGMDSKKGQQEQGGGLPSFSEVLCTLERQFNPIPCDRCQRCRCPHGTEIHTVFRQYHYYFMGKDYWALKKLDLGIKESAAHCRECTAMPCLKECPAGIRIPDEMQKLEKLVLLHPILSNVPGGGIE